ncbi:MAG TPA: hypothetical protein VIL00_11060 [Pseudonocardiaceae bacterium]
MRPWTKRTLHAAVLAAGFTALGASMASASPAQEPRIDLPTTTPTELNLDIPLDTCNPPSLEFYEAHGVEVPEEAVPYLTSNEQVPCWDASLHLNVPNVPVQAGTALAGTTSGLAHELVGDDEPITDPHNVEGVLGLLGVDGRGEGLIHQRPEAGFELAVDNVGVLDDTEHLASLDVGPYDSQRPQALAVGDLGVEADFLHGHTIRPFEQPLGSTPSLEPLTQLTNITPQVRPEYLLQNVDLSATPQEQAPEAGTDGERAGDERAGGLGLPGLGALGGGGLPELNLLQSGGVEGLADVLNAPLAQAGQGVAALPQADQLGTVSALQSIAPDLSGRNG